MNVLNELVGFIKSSLKLDVRMDLNGNEHICLLFGDEVISNITLNREEL